MVTVVIVEKNGSLKSTVIKDFKEEELYKKAGFKKPNDFIKQHSWTVKTGGKKYIISVYAKTDGKANCENKYDFPPPIDSTLFFGNCIIVATDYENNLVDLSLQLWNSIYEKLFGGFEDLAATAIEDELEEDELANVPKEKKTKNGYLKDGFVVDTDEDDECYEESDELTDSKSSDDDEDEDDAGEDLDDIGSELSEESYDYDSDKEKN